jgi:hypothetical protein
MGVAHLASALNAPLARNVAPKEIDMKKTLIALTAALTVAAATMAAPTQADARDRGGAVAAGIIGGLAAGAIIGGAVANSPPPQYRYRTYAPVSGYEHYGAYSGRHPVGCPGGYWARRPIVDRYGYTVGYSKPRFFCPY